MNIRFRIDLGAVAGIVAAVITVISLVLGPILGPDQEDGNDAGSSFSSDNAPVEGIDLPTGENPEYPLPGFEDDGSENPIVVDPEPTTPPAGDLPVSEAPLLIQAHRTDNVTVLGHHPLKPGVPFRITGLPTAYNSTTHTTVQKADGTPASRSVTAEAGPSTIRVTASEDAPINEVFVVRIYTDNRLVAEGSYVVVDRGNPPAIPAAVASDASGWSEAPFSHPRGQVTPPTATDFPINYKVAQNLGYLTPGVAFYSDVEGGISRCSAGFFVTINGEEYMVTAGHCGERNQEIWIYDQNFNKVPVGRFTDGEYTLEDVSYGQADWALVKLYDSASVNPAIGGQFPIFGYVDIKDLPSDATICHLGDTTGYQCGSRFSHWMLRGSDDIYYATVTANQGDSGGATFTVIDGKAYAVGVASAGGGQYYAFQEIASVLRKYNAKFYGSMK